MKVYTTIGEIRRLDPELDLIIDAGAKMEVVADGFDWSEGPLWIPDQRYLLFSDIPPNKIFKWTEAGGAELYLTPSGYTGTATRGGEPGSNGLLLSPEGKLVLCQHGDRRMAMMDADLAAPEPRFITLADRWEGKRLNSPNDAVYRSDGALFFTDPPYGLVGNMDDPGKEIPFQGLYKFARGEVSLLTATITRPNGLAFFPGEKTLVVANSDPEKAVWYLFDIDANDALVNERILFDATPLVGQAGKGLPDGLKIDQQGNLFATGPGGVWIFGKSGNLIGRLFLPEACSNIALADDEKTLFITADRYLLRLRMRR